MDSQAIADALARLEAAAARIEAVAARPRPTGDPALARRHEALRQSTRETLAELDGVIANLSS